MNLDELEPPFVRCLELAWDACAAGTVGVGAVITDGEATTLAEGRNQIFADGNHGPLRRTVLAHAETNALAQLDVSTDFSTCTVWTSLEPCVMCSGALMMASVGTVRTLAADPFMNGMAAMASVNPWIDDSWPRPRQQPDAGWSAIARMLALHLAVFWQPTGRVAQHAAAHEPEIYAMLTDHIVRSTLADLATSDSPLTAVVEALATDACTLRAGR